MGVTAAIAPQHGRASDSSQVSLRFCLLQISDVTVSVTRERVLRDRQNARYHAIVDSARDAIITTGTDHKIHWVNSCRRTGFRFLPRRTARKGALILLIDTARRQTDHTWRIG